MIDEKKFMEFMTSLKEAGAEHISFDDLRKFIEEFPKTGEWIPCSERLPDECDSIFAQFKGTDKWSSEMFEKISYDVNTTVEYENGKRKVKALHTIDGKWDNRDISVNFKVIAWQPLPKEYLGGE